MDTSTGSKRHSKESKKQWKEAQDQARLETKFGMITDKYDVKGIISDGVGQYAPWIFSAVTKKNGEKVAVKKIKIPFHDKTKAMKILAEIKISSHLRNRKFIVELKDILVRPEEKTTFEHIYLVSEKMDEDFRATLDSKSQDKIYIAQLLLGLDQIHNAQIIHGDLKPENLLVRKENSILKICDFGESRSTRSKRGFDRSRGSLHYSAPELLLWLDTGIATTSADIWSTGCIFAELLLGHRLNGKDFFRGTRSKATKNIHQLKNIISILGIPNDMKMETWNSVKLHGFCEKLKEAPVPLSVMYADEDVQAITLLEKMLKFDPTKRITAEQALQDDYIQAIINENDFLKNTTQGSHDCQIEELIHATDDCQLEEHILGADTLTFGGEMIRDRIWEEVERFHKNG